MDDLGLDVLAGSVRSARKMHSVRDNAGGGFDCACGARWDWTERKESRLHEDRAIVRALTHDNGTGKHRADPERLTQPRDGQS